MQRLQSLVLVGGGELFCQVKYLLSNNRGVEKSKFTGEQRHPLLFLVAAVLDYSVAEATPHKIPNFMEGWEVLFMMGSNLVGIHSLLQRPAES